MTISEYLKGKITMSVGSNVINTILFDRKVIPDADVNVVNEKTRNLCTADLYKTIALAPSTRHSVMDADGNWSHSEGGWKLSISEKNTYLTSANLIYRQYGEPEVVLNNNNVFKITKL